MSRGQKRHAIKLHFTALRLHADADADADEDRDGCWLSRVELPKRVAFFGYRHFDPCNLAIDSI